MDCVEKCSKKWRRKFQFTIKTGLTDLNDGFKPQKRDMASVAAFSDSSSAPPPIQPRLNIIAELRQ
jgi:hypothetical protein